MTKTLSKTVPETAPRSRAKPRKKPADRDGSAAAREIRIARYQLGDVVKHRVFPFRGVIFDIDPSFSNTEEWYCSIPQEVRPAKDQPFYHLLAENADTEYVAYVSEQNLLPDTTGTPLRHPQVKELFVAGTDGRYRVRFLQAH
jgi:heat shock protein HspQ